MIFTSGRTHSMPGTGCGSIFQSAVLMLGKKSSSTSWVTQRLSRSSVMAWRQLSAQRGGRAGSAYRRQRPTSTVLHGVGARHLLRLGFADPLRFALLERRALLAPQARSAVCALLPVLFRTRGRDLLFRFLLPIYMSVCFDTSTTLATLS